jgi:hypothetical protein
MHEPDRTEMHEHRHPVPAPIAPHLARAPAGGGQGGESGQDGLNGCLSRAASGKTGRDGVPVLLPHRLLLIEYRLLLLESLA